MPSFKNNMDSLNSNTQTSYPNFANTYNDISFDSSLFNTFSQTTPTNYPFSTQTQNVQPEKKEISTCTKIGLWALVATGLAIGADYLFCKGKYCNYILKSFKGNTNKVTRQSDSLADDAVKVAKEAEAKVAQEARATSNIDIVRQNNLKNGWKLTTKDIEIVGKNGEKNKLIFDKYEYIGDGAYGKQKEINFKFYNAEGKEVGGWEGTVLLNKKQLNGHMSDTMRGGKRVKGLGTRIAELRKNEAIASGCDNIHIDAAYGSHIFHHKMGFKADFAEFNCESAINVLEKINKEAVPEFSQRINEVLKSNNVEKINNLLNDILTAASSKKY